MPWGPQRETEKQLERPQAKPAMGAGEEDQGTVATLRPVLACCAQHTDEKRSASQGEWGAVHRPLNPTQEVPYH